jgi:hypothetical protein
MSYLTLADQLQTVAAKLRPQAHQLEGKGLATAASTLATAVLSFEKKLDDCLGGLGPGIQDCVELLKSPAGKALKLPDWIKLSHAILSSPATQETVAKVKAHLLKEITRLGKGELAREKLQAAYRQAAIPLTPVPKEKAALQAEFLRLGSLEDEAMLTELETRYKKLTDLKALAAHNAIVVSKATKKERLIAEIARYARQAAQNVRQ